MSAFGASRAMTQGMTAIALVAAVGCGAEPPCTDADLAPLPRAPAYAVLSSDFVSSAVGVLDQAGEPITASWLDSGTTAPGLSTALSGDAVLPTEPPPPGALLVIDRLGVDVITRIAVPSGEVIAQTPTTPPPEPSETAFRANPQDVLVLDGGRALVSRFEPNLDPEAAPLDRGNDLVLVDLASETLVERIDLSPLDAVTEAGGEETRFYARPSRLSRAGDAVVVGLGRLSLGFEAGPGAVAIVDLEAGSTTALPLSGLSNCGEVHPVPDAPNMVAVACAGSTFTDETRRRSGAGVAMLGVPSEGDAEVVWMARASDRSAAPVVTHGLVPLSPRRLVAVALGDDEAPDRLVTVTPEATDVIAQAAAPFVLGRGTFDAARSTLLVPEAGAGIRRFEVGGDSLREGTPVELSDCTGLGVREVRGLR